MLKFGYDTVCLLSSFIKKLNKLLLYKDTLILSEIKGLFPEENKCIFKQKNSMIYIISEFFLHQQL